MQSLSHVHATVVGTAGTEAKIVKEKKDPRNDRAMNDEKMSFQESGF